MYLTQKDKQDILRTISDLDERLTRALLNIGYDADGKRLELETRSKSDADYIKIMTGVDL